jgi:hypothetical protein
MLVGQEVDWHKIYNSRFGHHTEGDPALYCFRACPCLASTKLNALKKSGLDPNVNAADNRAYLGYHRS